MGNKNSKPTQEEEEKNNYEKIMQQRQKILSSANSNLNPNPTNVNNKEPASTNIMQSDQITQQQKINQEIRNNKPNQIEINNKIDEEIVKNNFKKAEKIHCENGASDQRSSIKEANDSVIKTIKTDDKQETKEIKVKESNDNVIKENETSKTDDKEETKEIIPKQEKEIDLEHVTISNIFKISLTKENKNNFFFLEDYATNMESESKELAFRIADLDIIIIFLLSNPQKV